MRKAGQQGLQRRETVPARRLFQRPAKIGGDYPFQRESAAFVSYELPLRIGFEATGNYHRQLTHHPGQAGFDRALAPHPDASFSEAERRMPEHVIPGRRRQEPRTLEFYVRVVARLGAYLDRASDAPPKTTVIWRGFSRLADFVEGARTAAPPPDTDGKLQATPAAYVSGDQVTDQHAGRKTCVKIDYAINRSSRRLPDATCSLTQLG